MSHPLLKTLISEMVESYLEESYNDDLVESIFEEVSEETWEAIEEAILNELSPATLKSYRDAALSRNKSDFDDLGIERERSMKKYGHNHSSAAYNLDKKIKQRGKYINMASKKRSQKI